MYEIQMFHLRQKTTRLKLMRQFLFLQAERCGSKFCLWPGGRNGHPLDQTPGGLQPQDSHAYIWNCSANCRLYVSAAARNT